VRETDFHRLCAAFETQRRCAQEFAAAFNEKLPSDMCPKCTESSHVPGLTCVACGYKHTSAWAIVRDTEFGYDVVALTSRRTIYASFVVEDV